MKTRLACTAICALIITLGSVRADTTNTWDGNGDSNNDGNWSTVDNWDVAVPNGPNDWAVLPTVTGNGNSGNNTRTITVDAVTTANVVTVGYDSSFYNKILLNADLTVDRFEGLVYAQDRYVPIDINGHTLTVGLYDSDTLYSPHFGGTGLVHKIGSGTLRLTPHSSSTPFTGTFQVDNGYLKSSWGTWNSTAIVQVNSGGTFEPAGSGMQPNFILNGPGYNNVGALRAAGWDWIKNSGTITVQTDASLYVDSDDSLSYGGYLRGSGTLTVFGGGTFTLSGTEGPTNTVSIVVDAGLLEITGVQSNLVLTINNGAEVDVQGYLWNSDVTVKSGGLFTCPSANVTTNVTVEAGGTWDDTTPPGWKPNGDNNNDGVWSDTSNWGEGFVPTNIAIFGTVNANGNSGTSVRYATNDIPGHSVVEIQMSQDNNGFYNGIYVLSNLIAGSVTGPAISTTDDYRINIDDGATFSVGKVGTNSYATSFLPEIQGSGTLQKLGAEQVTLIRAPSFTGTFEVDEGMLVGSWASVSVGASMIVNSGATYYPYGQGENLDITLNGPGHNAADGALKLVSLNAAKRTKSKPTTVATDSTLYLDGPPKTQTMAHSGTLDGDGVLTLIGGGTLDINGEWIYSVENGIGNGIIASTGTVDIAGAMLTITNTAGLASGGQYVVVDYASSSGSSVGTFASTNGLPDDWVITYVGTASNPDAVVLVPPPAGTVISIK